jgi:hypothetical protein
VKYEWYFLIWRGIPYYLRIYCVAYLYWSCVPCSHYVHGVYLCYFMIFVRIWSITFCIKAPIIGFLFLNKNILNFFVTFAQSHFRRIKLEDFENTYHSIFATNFSIWGVSILEIDIVEYRVSDQSY